MSTLGNPLVNPRNHEDVSFPLAAKATFFETDDAEARILHVNLKDDGALTMELATRWVDIALTADADVIIQSDRRTAPGRSILELLLLFAEKPTEISVYSRGSHALAALNLLRQTLE